MQTGNSGKIYRFLQAIAGVLGILYMSYSTPILAQVSAGGTPISFTSNIPQNIHTVSTLPVNVDSLLAEDEREAAEGMPFRFGFGFDVEYSFYNSGTWVDLPDGGANPAGPDLASGPHHNTNSAPL